MVWTLRPLQRETFFAKQEAGSVTVPIWKLYKEGKIFAAYNQHDAKFHNFFHFITVQCENNIY